MAERIVFVTGRLAERRLRQVLAGMEPCPFAYDVRQIGVKVAALMTPEHIKRRLGEVDGADRVVLPGRVRGDLEELGRHFGVPFTRGPDELKDLPELFGRKAGGLDLSRHDVRIFAEIVEAPELELAAILARARALRGEGADIIDLGCLPGTPFPHLEDAVRMLRAAGFEVSVDSADPEELLRGGRAGAGFLLSLTEETLWIADEVPSVPVLIPARHGELDSLVRAIEAMQARGRRFLADPVLDPIHFGFTDSLVRYHELRRRCPDAPILMGIGNLTELTDADTPGVTMTLMAVVSELHITNVLVVQVSRHCRRAVREAELARRILFAAREEGSLPQGFHDGLLCLRDRRPFPSTPEEIAELAGSISDPSFRVEVADDGIHVYNRDGHRLGRDPFELFPCLKVEHDAPHAFYLGVELARARIAWQLGKRYVQDQELSWGCAVDREEQDADAFAAPGATLAAKDKGRR